jgi:tRNA modification GTPase
MLIADADAAQTQRVPGLQADTIAAVATAPGIGGVGVVRVSGPTVTKVMAGIVGVRLEPRRATYARFVDRDGVAIDSGIALYFPGPGSYTGEDVLELQGHGGPVVLDLLVKRTLELGARPAEPGEFTRRAFLNDKLDLAQAEAVADLIEASTEQAARSAQRSLDGALSKPVQEIVDELVSLRVFLEGALDFPEEDVDFLGDARIAERIGALIGKVEALISIAEQGVSLRDGLSVAILGRPNVGKSSLLNQLVGEDVAIVTEVPGTTRDVLREQIHIDGLPIRLLDTAGIHPTEDRVELEGIERAHRAARDADLVLVVIADDAAPGADLPMDECIAPVEGGQRITVLNKVDLTGRPAGRAAQTSTIAVSARTGAGIDDLKAAIRAIAGLEASTEGVFMARRRHIRNLNDALGFLERAGANVDIDAMPELTAEELRLAQRSLDDITGRFTSEDLLGEIFSRFCIGK